MFLSHIFCDINWIKALPHGGISPSWRPIPTIALCRHTYVLLHINLQCVIISLIVFSNSPKHTKKGVCRIFDSARPQGMLESHSKWMTPHCTNAHYYALCQGVPLQHNSVNELSIQKKWYILIAMLIYLSRNTTVSSLHTNDFCFLSVFISPVCL